MTTTARPRGPRGLKLGDWVKLTETVMFFLRLPNRRLAPGIVSQTDGKRYRVGRVVDIRAVRRRDGGQLKRAHYEVLLQPTTRSLAPLWVISKGVEPLGVIEALALSRRFGPFDGR